MEMTRDREKHSYFDEKLPGDEKYGAAEYEHWSGESGFTHRHDYLELLYIEDGSGFHTSGAEPRAISRGDLLMIGRGAAHSESGNLKVVSFGFLPEFLAPELEGATDFADIAGCGLLGLYDGEAPADFGCAPDETIYRDAGGSLSVVFGELAFEYSERLRGRDGMMRALLIQALITALRQADSERSNPEKAIVRELTRWIRQGVTSELTLATFAAEHHYSAAYLSRIFHAETGLTFSKYAQRAKLGEACRMLETTSLSAAEIRGLLKYSDPKHFYRIFREYTSTTPAAYRSRFAKKQ